MRTLDFDYHLPEDMIAQRPPEKRGNSRMLVLDHKTGDCEIRKFPDIVEYISPGDCMVVNNTKVMNARFFGKKEKTGANIELLLTMPLNQTATVWKSLVKPGKRVKEGTKIILIPTSESPEKYIPASTDPSVKILNKNEAGSFNIEFNSDDMEYIQQHYGHTPLPPYIKRSDEEPDKNR